MSWYIAKTNPRCEERALAGLQAQGFDVHLPRGVKLVRRRHARQPIPTTFPLLTGYMFVAVNDRQQSFGKLRATDGIHSVLGRQIVDVGQEARNRYVPVAGSIVDEFRRLEAAGKFDATFEAPPTPRTLVPGDTVEVSEGPLVGVRFMFDDYFGKHSARVLRQLFGILRPITIENVDLLRKVA